MSDFSGVLSSDERLVVRKIRRMWRKIARIHHIARKMGASIFHEREGAEGMSGETSLSILCLFAASHLFVSWDDPLLGHRWSSFCLPNALT